MKKKIFIFLLIIFFTHLAFRIFSYRGEYLNHFDSQYWEYRYLHSQWVDPLSTESIGDDGLYAYAGWKYVTGADPSLINAEMSPLGKYLIGLSILAFGNQNIFALIFGLLSLSAFYLFNTQIFKDKLLSFLPVFIFSLEPLFYEQLRAPFLDLLFLTELFFAFYFFLKKRFIIATIFLGCMAATKFSSLSILAVFCFCVFLLIKRNKNDIKGYVFSLPLVPLVFTLSYLRFFFLGHSLREFLGLQKFIVTFYAVGAKASFGIVFPMLFTGDWYTWFAGIQRVAEWNILWPIACIGSLGGIFYLIKDKKIDSIVLVAIWIVVYIIFLCFTPVTSRYLLLLLPFMYSFTLYLFYALANSMRKQI